MNAIKSSELITNEDGTIFHLHLHAEDLADNVVLVGDPSRVEMIASRFDSIELTRGNREFHTITGPTAKNASPLFQRESVRTILIL